MTVPIPDDLRRLLQEAAATALEIAADGEWSDAKADAIIAAVHVIHAIHEGTATPEEIAQLADRAARELQVDTWPTTIEQAEDLARRAQLLRDLLVLRDAQST
jgi:hypothetical protein